MIHGNEPNKMEAIPPARHRHSAVVFDQGMWVYGGMTDLQERSDLWRLDLGESCAHYFACARPFEVPLSERSRALLSYVGIVVTLLIFVLIILNAGCKSCTFS